MLVPVLVSVLVRGPPCLCCGRHGLGYGLAHCAERIGGGGGENETPNR